MKKLLTKKDQEKKVKRNQIIIGVVLIGLMLFSTLAYALSGAFGDSDETEEGIVEYNGIIFNRYYDSWAFNYQGDDFVTRYNPIELESIQIESGLTLNDFKNKPFYLVGNSDASYELTNNLQGRFVLRMQKGCLVGEECDEALPIKDCSIDNVLVIKEPLNESIETSYQQDNCFFIIANSENQTKYIDAFLFDILGI